MLISGLLFTGGGGAGNEAIFRLWRDRYDLHFADADPDAIAPSIPKSRCQEQFELLRAVDNRRCPAFFDYRGHRYTLTIEKLRNGTDRT